MLVLHGKACPSRETLINENMVAPPFQGLARWAVNPGRCPGLAWDGPLALRYDCINQRFPSVLSRK